MTDTALAWRVEQACLLAWPDLDRLMLDGWLLRFSQGVSRRANCVNPLTPGVDGMDAKIAACERLYRARNLPVLFRIPAIAAGGAALDAELARRGYSAEGHTLTRFGTLGDAAHDAALDAAGVDLSDLPTPQWLAAACRIRARDAAQSAAYGAIVRRLTLPAIFAAVRGEDGIEAVGIGAIHDGLACLESIATDPAHTRKGHGRRIVGAILNWARARHATGACLQVEADNAPAIALYEGLGMNRDLYAYHYRRGPDGA